MSLNTAHEGYEYQDLLSAFFILDWILEDIKSTFTIDKKEYESDRFDDLTVQNERGIFKKQIKYSNNYIDHSLVKSDLSTDGPYGLAIDELFKSWHSHPDKKSVNIRLCLAWNEPTDELTDILISSTDIKSFTSHDTKLYKINAQELWPENQKPLPNWKRFREKSKDINRDEFIEFCKHLTIETNLPKSSTFIYEPDKLEKIVLDQTDRLGIGSFPNNAWKKEEFILSLLALIKKSRSKGTQILTQDIFNHFQIKTDYGSIEQNFPIDASRNIPLSERISSFILKLNQERKVILVGEPESGKSWFIENLIKALNEENVNTIKHYCYTEIQDKYQKERIKIDVFYGNLISDILNIYPHLKEKKRQRYASNLSELNLLIENIDEPTVLIIDGLDHIQRIYNYRPYHDIAISDIEIINEINKIRHSKYLSILIASQPIAELDNISGFSKSSLPIWNKSDVVELMSKLYIDDSEIGSQNLSDLLLKKSAGNPLYLTYLVEELKSTPKLNEDVLNSIPSYSFNLKEYYSYLLSKLNLKENVALVLSAVNFSLTKKELKEITGLGSFVDDSLNLLKPVLRQNQSSSGYLIYHESFRRFIIEHLKTKEIVEERIFLPIISWFEKLDFYNYPKAFRFYLQVLIDGGYFSKALIYISKDFIKKSVCAGQPWEIIENNYYLLVKAGTETQNFQKVILLNELNKTLSGTEDAYNESFSNYIEALGCKYGFNQVADFLVFEGKPTLTLQQGLKVCYLIDKRRKVAPWEYYSEYFKKDEPINLDDFQYYVRLQLIKNDKEELKRLASKIKSKKFHDFGAIFKKELESFWNIEFVEELKKEKETIGKLFKKEKSSAAIAKHDLVVLADEILLFENIFDSEIPKIKNFFKQVEYQIEDSQTISIVIKKFSSINWFYNWLIYYIKINVIRFSKKNNSSELRKAFDYLGYNTEPFVGNPRTCDLYYLQDFIYNSINEGLTLIQKEEDWEYILAIIEKVSNNTTTSLQKSLGGPLATDKLFDICLENIQDVNCHLIIDTLEKQYNEKKEYHLHSYISGYCFQLAKAYAEIDNNEKVDTFFNLGVDYTLGYTMRRDLTIEDLIESIESLYHIDIELADEYILKIKELVDSVVEHTDGKDTQHFPIEWFKKFFNINPYNATLYLLNELVKTRFDWRLESSLKYLLNQLDTNTNTLAKCYLNQTLLVESDDAFLSNSLKLLDNLSLSPAKDSLIATIKSRIDIKQNSERSIDFQKNLIKYSNEFKLPENYFSLIKARNSRKTHSIDTIEKLKRECISRKEFSDMNTTELSDYIKEKSILDKEIQSLIYVFDGFQQLTPELKKIIQHLVSKNENYHDERNVDITPLFVSTSEVSIYFWIFRFIYQKDGWFKSLSNLNAFITAYNINPGKSLEFLFELLPGKLKLGGNRVFSANLLNALTSVDFDSSIIREAWLSLYDLIESRLPTRNKFDWNMALKNEYDMNTNEIVICILLSRFKSCTVEKFHIVLSGIANLLYSDSKQMIKPLKWFFSNFENFKKSIQLAILELVVLFNEKNKGFVSNFESELKSIYPTDYFLIDYLIAVSFKLPERSVFQTTNDLIYPISENDIKFFTELNFRHKILLREGIDITNTFGKFKATFARKYQDSIDLYLNRMHEWTVNNIYVSDYLLELINKDYYDVFKNRIDEDNIHHALTIDIKTIVAQYLSLTIRPSQLKKYTDYEGISSLTEDIQIENGWVRLGHFEYELIEQERYKLNDNKTFGGITFHEKEKPIFPYSGYVLNMESIWNGICPPYEIDDTLIFSFIQKRFQFEDFKILWLNPVLVSFLGLRVCNFISGLCAVNENNEIVLKFNSWITDYIASDYSNDIKHEIPKLDGSELLIREDYFSKICEMYDYKPKYCIFKTF